MRRTLANVVAVAILASAQGALAQAPSNDARARAIFDRSEEAYKAGRYGEAIELLSQAYELKHDPVLLHNTGVAYEAEKDYPRAVQAFERCVREYPDYDRCSQRLETARAAAAAAGEKPNAVTLEKPAPSPSVERRPASPWPWVVTAVGVAGLAGGGVLTLLAAKRSDDAQAAASAPSAQSIHDTALAYQTAGTAAFVAGAVVTLIGATWIVVDIIGRDARRPTVSARARVKLSAAGILFDSFF